jgi:hypothetical protein
MGGPSNGRFIGVLENLTASLPGRQPEKIKLSYGPKQKY